MPEKKIGSRTYRAEKMPATEGTRKLIKLTKMLGPALPKLSSIMNESENERDAKALSAISDLLMASDADELTDFIVSIAEKAEVKDGSVYDGVIYDLHLSDLGEAFQVVAFVLQVNYRDFFGGKMGNILKATTKSAA